MVSLPPARSFLTAAAATAQEDEPDARVHPAPRSQMRISSRSRARTRANCTFVRFGNAACVSIRGPSCRTSSSSSFSVKTTQCGFPTETHVTVRKRSPTWSGTETTSRSGPCMGISGARNVACPISTVTWSTRSPTR
jgi:hypothetical protein